MNPAAEWRVALENRRGAAKGERARVARSEDRER